MHRSHCDRPPWVDPDPSHAGGEIVEVGLLLSARQAAALEASAHRAGLTTGAMVRRLIGDFLGGPAAGPPAAGPHR